MGPVSAFGKITNYGPCPTISVHQPVRLPFGSFNSPFANELPAFAVPSRRRRTSRPLDRGVFHGRLPMVGGRADSKLKRVLFGKEPFTSTSHWQRYRCAGKLPGGQFHLPLVWKILMLPTLNLGWPKKNDNQLLPNSPRLIGNCGEADPDVVDLTN